MKKLALISLIFFSCSEKADITGLWELHKVSVDMYDRGFNPTYLKFEKDGTFSASKVDGDLVGLYKIEKSVLSLSSNDQKWFDKSWELFANDEELVLNDLKHSFRGEQLRFRKIDKFPSFEEFMEKLNGTWELYRIVEKGKERRVTHTFFTMEDNQYSITEKDQIIESGNISVDTRHHKITFENMDIIWDVRFVWDDLRLENEERGVMYRLRKT